MTSHEGVKRCTSEVSPTTTCGLVLQAHPLSKRWRRAEPVLHCPHCDRLEVMTAADHTPPADLARVPADLT